VLQIPRQAERISRFLDHVWAFDRAVVTDDARHRTRQYQENSQREALRAGTSSFAEFLASLDLRVTIEPLQSTQFERAAELTQRTNQFNLRPQPRHAGEIRALGSTCLGVTVTDRFGDYGLTGVIAYEVRGTVLRVDTLLLSCRVLGRGVEHQVMAHLGRIAEQGGCETLELPFTETGRNGPVLSFLETTGGFDRTSEPLAFTIPAFEARSLKPAQAPERGAAVSIAKEALSLAESVLDSDLIQHIADSLATTQQIAERLSESRRRVSDTQQHEYQPPETLTEQELASIWSRVLNRDKISRRDDFFQLGGHSLLAAQVVSQIRTAFRIDLPLRALFEAPTVEALAVMVDEAQLKELDQFDETELEEMLARMGGEN
jgi:acyl carrier protein